MRSAADAQDATARARIRGAAIAAFATEGFSAPLRRIAAAARVSAPLIVHHFGSKDGLRAACDEHVLRVIRQASTEAYTEAHAAADALSKLAHLAESEQYAGSVAYLLRAVREGGPVAVAFIAHLVDDTAAQLRAGVDAGRVRSARDPAARARMIAYQSLGALLVHAAAQGIDDPGELVRSFQRLTTLSTLELLTEGKPRDDVLLEGYLAARATEHQETEETT